jgi:hypothetical protein
MASNGMRGVGVLVLGGERTEEDEETRPRVGINGTEVLFEDSPGTVGVAMGDTAALTEDVSRMGTTGLATGATTGVTTGTGVLIAMLCGMDETKATGTGSIAVTGTGVCEGDTLLETAAELASLFCSLSAS